MAIDKLITVTLKDDAATSLEISTHNVVLITGTNSDTDSLLTIISNGQKKSLLIDEDPTTAKALDPYFINLVETSTGDTLTVNAQKIEKIYPTEAGGSRVELDDNTSAWMIKVVNDTPAAIKATVNAL